MPTPGFEPFLQVLHRSWRSEIGSEIERVRVTVPVVPTSGGSEDVIAGGGLGDVMVFGNRDVVGEVAPVRGLFWSF